MQWIRERNAETEQYQNQDNFRTQEDFCELMLQVDKNTTGVIDSLAESLVASDEPLDIDSFQERVQGRVKPPFAANMLLTLACAQALSRSPQLATWQKIRLIAYNSWEVEHWLKEAMAAWADKNTAARQSYIELGSRLFKALESGELKSQTERKNEERKSAWEHWQLAKYPLDELWYGLRGSDFIMYEEEMRIFGLLSQLSPDDFQQLIIGSTNPFLVDCALLNAGIGAFSPCFSQWEACAKIAPLAFSEDGSWTGSILMPLLLVHARNELMQPCQRVPRHGADEDEVAALTGQVEELVQVVVGILASRVDALPMFARWSTWLMRQMLVSRDEDFTDIRSYKFVDSALLEAMGKSIQGRPMVSTLPHDAAPWEAWSYRCVKSSWAHDGFIQMPSFDNFSRQWCITPENWHGTEGRYLLEHAQLHINRDDILGMSDNLLVLPLASRNEFAHGWQELWKNTYYLREVLEFGSIDAGTRTYSDRADASRLLLLLVRMGLACFDQASARLEASTAVYAEEMVSLHGALVAAAMEVLHVDDTLNRDEWLALLQHLALRRVYWDVSYTAENRAVVFTGGQVPTIRDYMNYFQPDPGELVVFLHSCMLNGLGVSKLREELRSASVDLRSCVNTLKRLNLLRAHRYPLNERAIKAIEPLIDDHER